MESYILIGIIVFVIVIIPIMMYNSLVGRRNQVRNAFSSIDVMLKKRFDLIPNLVETVKQYATHEKELLTNITSLRSGIASPNLSNGERISMENELTQKLNQLNINIENYPDLKANTNFLNLQANLTEIESQLSASRRAFNASVLDYNNSIDKFPSSIIAGMFGFVRETFFEIPELEKQNPSVKSLSNN